jgi:hypothetical protein
VTEYDALREESARLVAVDDREGWAKVVERMDRIARRRVEEEPGEDAELTLGLVAETRTGVRNGGRIGAEEYSLEPSRILLGDPSPAVLRARGRLHLGVQTR